MKHLSRINLQQRMFRSHVVLSGLQYAGTGGHLVSILRQQYKGDHDYFSVLCFGGKLPSPTNAAFRPTPTVSSMQIRAKSEQKSRRRDPQQRLENAKKTSAYTFHHFCCIIVSIKVHFLYETTLKIATPLRRVFFCTLQAWG